MSFALWFTGPPASGKTTVARAVWKDLAARGTRAAFFESDELRAILTPDASYKPEERDRFYRELADLAALLASQEIPVIVDATAPRREHRDRARRHIPQFAEIHVSTPLRVREARDPKGLYRLARNGEAPNLPGFCTSYDEPKHPELVVSGEERIEVEVERIMATLGDLGFVPAHVHTKLVTVDELP